MSIYLRRSELAAISVRLLYFSGRLTSFGTIRFLLARIQEANKISLPISFSWCSSLGRMRLGQECRCCVGELHPGQLVELNREKGTHDSIRHVGVAAWNATCRAYSSVRRGTGDEETHQM